MPAKAIKIVTENKGSIHYWTGGKGGINSMETIDLFALLPTELKENVYDVIKSNMEDVYGEDNIDEWEWDADEHWGEIDEEHPEKIKQDVSYLIETKEIEEVARIPFYICMEGCGDMFIDYYPRWLWEKLADDETICEFVFYEPVARRGAYTGGSCMCSDYWSIEVEKGDPYGYDTHITKYFDRIKHTNYNGSSPFAYYMSELWSCVYNSEDEDEE